MPSRDPRVDEYIRKAAPFAQPILTRLRGVVHRACPDVVEGMKWSDAGVKVPRAPRAKKPPVRPPTWFMAAVRKNKTALATFTDFSPSHKREYVEWVTEAKSDETRARRLATAIDWMAQGKGRNWKYERA